VRDFAALLPAEWQEAVKCRGTTGWEAWLDEVIATERVAHRRRDSWFWRVHDTLAILDMWSRHIPPDQVHVVTLPRRDPGGLLWARFAAVLGLDLADCDLTGTRRNSSLGFAETEFLRRMNQVLPAELPDWYYTRELKQHLAHGVLSTRPHGPRPALPPKHAAWAAEQAECLIAGLRDAKYHLVGDLAELRPTEQDAAACGPVSQSAEQQFEAAVQAVVALTDRYYHLRYPDEQPARRRTPRQVAASIKWRALNGPRVRRTLCGASQHVAVRRLRVVIWCVLIRPNRHRR
jgi:hypothetical protein